MKDVLLRRAIKLNKAHKQRKWWHRAVRAMSMVVVFCTTYALILPAITMEQEAICGYEAHRHGESCYVQQHAVEYVCGLDEQVRVAHSHDGLCYDAEGTLLCPLPELLLHTHDDSCYAPAEAPACGYEHTHGENCAQLQSVLVCALEETQGHTHTDDCTTGKVLVCDIPAGEEHTHAEDCYELRKVACAQEETPGHTHGPECYEEQVVFCDQPETQEHIHEDSCYPLQLVCGKEEIQLHTHGEACYNEDAVLICQLPQVVEHVHSDSCLTETEQILDVLVCELEEHIHEDSCYPAQDTETEPGLYCGFGVHTHVQTCFDDTGSLICSIPEHSHEPICWVNQDLTADVETAQQWEAAFAELTLTGNWPEDLLAVAKTQLNYRESETNVIQTEDGLLRGYTRYGAWRADPYGPWNTAFASFCLHYAGVEDFPVVPDPEQWIGELTRQERYQSAGGYIPKPGDLVFLRETLSENSPVRVGILAERIAPDGQAPGRIRIIAGDTEDRVDYVICEIADPAVLGYGILPEAPEGKYVCGMTAHSHCWLCADADGSNICGQAEHNHTVACEERLLYYNDDAMSVVMTIGGFEGIPEDLTLRVLPVTEETNTDTYGAMVGAVGETMADSAYYVEDAVFYRIELLSNGEVFPLPENIRTSVQITLLRPVFAPEGIGEAAQLRTFSLVEEEEETVEPEEAAGDAGAEMLDMLVAVADAMTYNTQPMMRSAAREEPAASYQAFALTAEQTPENQISLTSENATVFGVALADVSTVTGQWKRVTSTSELTSDGTYLIVSAEGNHTLSYNSTGTKVYMDSIKANEDYFHISTSNAADGAAINLPAAYWRFSGSGNSFTVTNATYNNYYLEISYSHAARQTGSWTDFDGVDALTLTYLPQEGAWTFQDDGYYLTNGNTANYSTSNGTSYGNLRSRSMLIFKLVNDSLYVPDDVVTSPDAGIDGEIPTKPTYPGYIGVSGGKTGETSYTIDESSSVSGSYYSDPATSGLETHFTGQSKDDGMVHSDKSVIYGDDDYNAFQTYEPNTFGVTLSALGQEFISGNQDYIKTPVDVMFVLDISGSMNAEKVPGSTTVTRSMAMVEAVNKTIAEIMDRNPDNRVGAVLYSSGTGNLLELGRYTEANDQFLEMRQGSWSSASGTFSGSFIYPNDTLYKDGAPYQDSGTYPYQFNGTYTQAGIALGAQKLMAVEDITTEVTAFAGTEHETTIKVRRQPVIILLSDGEPTHSTSNYKDVLSGPHYGDGLASSNEYRGVHGYYTVLSANYYKRMVGIHYHQPAQFYSVGMGINPTGATPASSSDDAYYKRAVLDPTPARVLDAYNNSTYNADNTSRQLYQLLNNTYPYNTVTVTADNQGFMPSWIGQVHAAVPVIRNPYPGSFSYADGAYFGNYNADQLAAAFGQILSAAEEVSPYGFILRSRTSMTMDDPIGEGMEVKGQPVLRYGGINYYVSSSETSADGSTVTYRYDGFYEANDGSGNTADLSKITVKVITDENGLQTVHMDIPDYVLPAYSPYAQSFRSDGTPYFYYEELPVRLIYQVGLTEESEAALEELYATGGTLTYYTNRYTGDDLAGTKLLPTNDNPYYMDNASIDEHENCHHTNKTENTTGTVDTSFECHHALVPHSGEMVPEVTQKLGNNGKLVFTAERTVIDIPVEKQWQNSVMAQKYDSVEVRLYSVVGETVTYVSSLTLQSSDWSGVFEHLPLLPEDGFYALAEVVPPGFMADYSGEVVSIQVDGKTLWAAKVSGQNPITVPKIVVTNSVGYSLPETGGSGTFLFTFGGLLMIAAACVYFVIQNERKYRKGGM